MASLKITIVVSADPSENVHSHIAAVCAEVREVGPMLERAIAAMQAEVAALPSSHSPTTITGDDCCDPRKYSAMTPTDEALIESLRRSSSDFDYPPSVQSMANIRAIEAMDRAADRIAELVKERDLIAGRCAEYEAALGRP